MSEQTELPSHNQEQIPLQKYLAMKTAQILKRANLQFAVDNFKHKLSSFLILMKGVGRTLRTRGQSSGSNSLKTAYQQAKKKIKKKSKIINSLFFFLKETIIYVLRNKYNPSYFRLYFKHLPILFYFSFFLFK